MKRYFWNAVWCSVGFWLSRGLDWVGRRAGETTTGRFHP